MKTLQGNYTCDHCSREVYRYNETVRKSTGAGYIADLCAHHYEKLVLKK